MKIEINNCYNMDCIEGMQLMIDQGIKADCILTDLPYNEINRESNGLRNLDKKNADILTFDLQKYLDLTMQCVKGNFLLFCGTEQVSEIRKFYASNGLSTRLIIWEKTNPSPMNGKSLYLSGIECCVYAKKKGATFNAFCKNTVFRLPSGVNEIHETQKPLSLWYELLKDNTNEGQLVLDTCMGSWTTAIACHKLSRNWIGFEIDKEYFEKGKKRYEQFSSQMSIFDL